MEQVSTKNEFEPRAGLERTLEYRFSVKLMYYFLLVGLPVIEIPVFFDLPLESKILFTIIIYGLIPAFAFLKMRPRVFAKYHINSRSLTANFKGKVSEFKIAEIQRVQLRLAPFFGGFFIIELADGRRLLVSSALERSDYILETIYSGKSGLIEKSKLRWVRHAAILADHNFARLSVQFKGWRRCAIEYILVPTLFVTLICVAVEALAYPRNVLKFSEVSAAILGLILLSWLWSVFVWLTTEIVYTMVETTWAVKNPNFVRRDLHAEKLAWQVSKVIQYGLVVLYTFFAI